MDVTGFNSKAKIAAYEEYVWVQFKSSLRKFSQQKL